MFVFIANFCNVAIASVTSLLYQESLFNDTKNDCYGDHLILTTGNGDARRWLSHTVYIMNKRNKNE